MHANEIDTQLFALKALGSICIRHYEFMLSQDLMNMYLEVLAINVKECKLKSQVSKKKNIFYRISKSLSIFKIEN